MMGGLSEVENVKNVFPGFQTIGALMCDRKKNN